MSEEEQKEFFVIEGITISNKRVSLDGNRFRNVTFDSCELVYGGGAFPEVHECVTRNCSWELAGPAHHAALFLKQMVSTGHGSVVAQFFDITAEHLAKEEGDAGD